MTEADLRGLNTYDFKFTWPEPSSTYVDLTVTEHGHPFLRIWIIERPGYCDRGRYGWGCESKDQYLFTIDEADGFPRYFFSLQRLLDELNDWVQFRNRQLQIDQGQKTYKK